MGALVWNVKHGMSGAISKDVADAARYHQDIRVVDNDLTWILKRVFAFAHITDDILPRTVKRDKILERYQVGYKELRDGDRRLVNRTYLINLTGLSNFATDYIDFWKRKDIKIDIQSLKEAIVRLLVEIDIPVDRLRFCALPAREGAVVLGSLFPMIRQIYSGRLASWEKWEAVSDVAQGTRG
jgi:hypothetical protein